MTSLLRSCRLALPLLALAAPGFAQQEIRPLGADPVRALHVEPASSAAQLRTTALALPFFDDFATPVEGRPNALRWEPRGGTLVSNRLAVNPPTRGAVTFDAFKADGSSYSVGSAFTNIDSLTSKAIDLSGLGAADAVALSFAWQTGSVVGGNSANTSSTPVRLELQFFDNTNRWVLAPGWLTAPNFLGRSTGVATTPFRQVTIPITQASFLHANFRFRFLAVGQASYAAHTWSVDYVLLDQGRAAGPTAAPDTTYRDVATSAGYEGGPNASGGLRSPLRRYTAMPVWQFNAAPSQAAELNPRLGVNVMNLNPGTNPLPTQVVGTVRELGSGSPLGTWLNALFILPTQPRLSTVQGDASQVAIPTTPQPKTLRYSLALGSLEPTPRTLTNDTISRDVELRSYYAFDDGSAEAAYRVFAAQGQINRQAYRIDLNQRDRVRGLRFYPVYETAADRQARVVTATVWADDNGHPGATILGSKQVTIPYPLPAGWDYYEVSFDTPVDVTGTFHVGFSVASGRDFVLGFDLNTVTPLNYHWVNTSGSWVVAPPQIRNRGSMMLRPVMNNNIATAAATARDAAAFALYPNPARGSVTVAGPAFVGATLLDALGRPVWQQPAAEAGRRQLPLAGLAPGLYVVRLALPDGSTATRRLLVE